MWCGPDDKPKAGSRIIAPYNDGSGAVMFIVVDDKQGGIRFIDQDGEEYPGDFLTAHDNFWFWACLPEGATLWCETREDDPINLDSRVPQKA